MPKLLFVVEVDPEVLLNVFFTVDNELHHGGQLVSDKLTLSVGLTAFEVFFDIVKTERFLPQIALKEHEARYRLRELVCLTCA